MTPEEERQWREALHSAKTHERRRARVILTGGVINSGNLEDFLMQVSGVRVEAAAANARFEHVFYTNRDFGGYGPVEPGQAKPALASSFDELECESTASPEEIRSSYRRLMRTHHPDVGGDPERAKALTAAYGELKKAGRAA